MNLQSEINRKQEELEDLKARQFNYEAICESSRRRHRFQIVLSFDRDEQEEDYDGLVNRGRILKSHPILEKRIATLISEYRAELIAPKGESNEQE